VACSGLTCGELGAQGLVVGVGALVVGGAVVAVVVVSAVVAVEEVLVGAVVAGADVTRLEGGGGAVRFAALPHPGAKSAIAAATSPIDRSPRCLPRRTLRVGSRRMAVTLQRKP